MWYSWYEKDLNSLSFLMWEPPGRNLCVAHHWQGGAGCRSCPNVQRSHTNKGLGKRGCKFTVASPSVAAYDRDRDLLKHQANSIESQFNRESTFLLKLWWWGRLKLDREEKEWLCGEIQIASSIFYNLGHLKVNVALAKESLDGSKTDARNSSAQMHQYWPGNCLEGTMVHGLMHGGWNDCIER